MVSLLFILVGFGAEQRIGVDTNMVPEEVVYHSDISAEDCYLCGGGIETIVPDYWGQDNIALISLNTFEIRPIEINRYDRQSGQLIEKASGTITLGAGGSQNGGFSAKLLLQYDRGYAAGPLELFDDKRLDVKKAASFLCQDCLNEILPKKIEECFGVGIINLKTKEIHMLEESLGGFEVGDFYVDYDLIEQNKDPHRMDLLIFYCPIRYEFES